MAIRSFLIAAAILGVAGAIAVVAVNAQPQPPPPSPPQVTPLIPEPEYAGPIDP